MRAAGLLAQGLLRGSPGWYGATTAVLASALAVLLLVTGGLAGVERATQERTADFYTESLRITPVQGGVAPAGHWEDAPDAVAALGLGPDEARLQFEGQALLSRQGFVQAFLSEREGFGVDSPGRTQGDAELAVGVLVGIRSDPATEEAIGPHLVSGALPRTPGPDDSVPIAMSLERLERFLTPDERDGLPWPPAPEDVRHLRFQLTSARLEGNRTLAEGGQLILRTAHIAGVFDSGLEVLDRFTFLAPIEDVRQLQGLAPDGASANVLLVADPPAGLAARAEDHGWSSTRPDDFTRAHVGQLLEGIRFLGTVAAVSLLLLPVFLVLHGLTRQLDAHRRELAVAHALGVPLRAVGRALGALVAALTAAAVLLAVLLALLGGQALEAWFGPRRDLPVPVGFELGAGMLLGVLLLAAALGALAWAGALWTHARRDVPQVLRAP